VFAHLRRTGQSLYALLLIALKVSLLLRRGNVSRDVGRIYRVTDQPESPWFWGVSFQLTGRKSYGHAASLDAAKAAFRAEYECWQRAAGEATPSGA
jgi:hypothetical protein